MNCKTYKTNIDEQLLNAEVLSHLEACNDCRTFREERECLQKLFEKLERIDAPANFEFGVRAKLQTAKTSGNAKDWRRRFVYAAPTVAAAAFVVYGVSNVSIFTPPANDNKTAVVQTAPQTTPEIVSVAQPTRDNSQINSIETGEVNTKLPESSSAGTLSVKIPEKSRAVAVPNSRGNEKRRDSREIVARDIEEPVSRDLASSPASSNMPNGINTVAPKTTTRSVLGFRGIEVSDNDWLVKSILPNSEAAGSGILVGDSIETINGQKASTTTLKGVEKEVVLEILRDGKRQKVVLTIKPNPQK